MSDRVKRALFAVAFLVFAGGVGVLMYWVFFRGGVPGLMPTQEATIPGVGSLSPSGPSGDRPATTPETPGTLPTTGETPGATPGTASTETNRAQTVLLRDGVTQSVTPSINGRGARYYNPDDGKFYVAEANVTQALSDTAFPSAESVTWANATDQAVITFPDGRNLHYDFRTQTQHTLPPHWKDFAFSPDDRQLVTKALATSPGSRFLIISNVDGSNPIAVEPLGENASRVFPSWSPNNQIIAYALTGNARGLDRQEVLMVGKNHENFRALQVEGRGFLPRWSPDGNTLLYSVWNDASDYRPELWVSGGSAATMNQNRTKLGIQTWADKCVWKDTATIYCAVPNDLPRGAGLQPDLFRNTEDTFIRIDLRSGARVQLGQPEGARSVQQPVLTNDASAILFTDGISGRLYQFNIP